MKKVAFHTLGCKVNQYETQAMMEIFKKANYAVVGDSESANVYVINTCTVTNMSEKKSRQFIRRAKRQNPDSIIVVVGCYVQVSPEEVSEIEGVNIVIGTNDRKNIIELIDKSRFRDKIVTVDDIMAVKEFEELEINEVKGKTRAFLKIQEGCNQYCSYCIIPYARGKIRSRKEENIVKEVERLVENGVKEIVLTGIHLASYGKERGSEDSLVNLLFKLDDVSGLERIRLGSLEPTLFTDEFLSKLVKVNKICDHFHLSLQSGCDEILDKMNRKYISSEYRNTVESIKKAFHNVAITTDLIVGFPGETADNFKTTYDFVNEMGFSEIHVFKFSPKKGTKAAKFKPQVNSMVMNKRSEELIKLGKTLQKDYILKQLNSVTDVLVENKSKQIEGCVEGLTKNYLKVVIDAKEETVGSIVKARLVGFVGDKIIGEIEN
ncbi:MAG: tRNA (N(6)-L-threonylcarbamoyladenosine(37)-C(2))-methylthiotransferase MtaB [Clostridiales bacterium]|nr:tRNA (N(6)-L-threonylcarbamoyladenosine(37)-C(2))-methylthiotransferase MtaB [Clostridiales bacterium]